MNSGKANVKLEAIPVHLNSNTKSCYCLADQLSRES